MAPKVPAGPARWQAAAAFQPVGTSNFAEHAVAQRNLVSVAMRKSPHVAKSKSSLVAS